MANLLTISNAAQDLSNAARELDAIQNAVRLANGRTLSGIIADRRHDIEEHFRSLAADLGFDVVPAAAKVREAAE